MAFNAGSAVGYFKLDNSNFIQGVTQAKQANESMTTSMVKAGIILEALKKGFQIVTGFVQDSTKAYIESEKAGAQLNAVLKSTGGAAGITANEVKALASKYQELTNFEDDAVISAQNLLLTFTNISKDIFPQTTETVLNMSQALGQDLKSSAIQLGKALQDPITGITALRRVGVNFTDSQQEIIKSLVESGRLLDAQRIILKELDTEFGGSAIAARQTFGGSVLYLNNIIGDLQETVGMFTAGFGKGFVDEMAIGVKAITEFINKASTISTLIDIASVAGGSISALKVVFSEILSIIKPVSDMILNSLVTGFESLNIKANASDVVMAMLSGGFTVLTGFIRLAGVAISGMITNIANFSNYIKEFIGLYPKVGKTIADIFIGIYNVIGQTITAARSLFESLKDPFNLEKWKTSGSNIAGIMDKMSSSFTTVVKDAQEINTQFGKAIDAGKKFVSSGISGYADILKTGISEISKFGDNSNAMYEKMSTAFKSGAVKTQEELKAFFNANPVEMPMTIGESGDETKITEKSKQEKQKINDKYNDEEKKKQEEHNKTMLANVSSYINASIQAAQILADGISSTLNTAYQNELDALTLKYEEQTAIIEDNQASQLENTKVVYDQEMSDLDNKLATKQITQTQYDIAAKEALTKKEAETKKINEKAALDKNALEKKQLEEENAIKKKQFETNKALSIVNVWLNLASAIMGYVASFAPMGIPGIVLMAVMSALATGMAIAQTVVISQQQFVPARAEGGDVIAGQPYNVGERGREIFVPGMSGTILNSAISREVMNNTTANSKNYNINITGNNISNELDLKKIAQYVNDEIGRQVG